MLFKNNIKNIGIIAHVDAGKTTLTEQLLFKSGNTRTLGSVDKGTTHTDSLEVERKRGISVKASEIDLSYKNTTINIIDTPGHIDFSAEVERSISVLDGAVTLLSSVEGVQPQTEVYFNTLKALKKPSIFFINKLDRIGANPEKVLGDIKGTLSQNLIPLQFVIEENNEFVVVDLFSELLKVSTFEEIHNSTVSNLLEDIISILGENNEDILTAYYDNSLSVTILKNEIIHQCICGDVYPVLFGAAIKGEGVLPLLDAIVEYLPSPKDLDTEEVSALVYKVSHDKVFGKISHIRIFSGSIESRDELFNYTKSSNEKITVIKKIVNQKEISVNKAYSGDFVMVSGLNCSIGDILGNPKNIPKYSTIATPLLTLKVNAIDSNKQVELVEALSILQEEDPLLNMNWIKSKNEINIQIMGKIQIEILESILNDRFNVPVTFGAPSVIYKETPIGIGYGYESYTMPKPCWAITKFIIEPLPLNSGILYEAQVRTEDVKLKYQREIENTLPKILEQGIYGWNVTDIKITFIEGQDHVMHSRPGDFFTSASMAIMKGLRDIGTTLLEPIIEFRISAPEEVSGKILNDIIQMRGTFDSPNISNGQFVVTGTLPLSTSLDYPVTLGMISSGKSIMSTKFHSYKPCPLELGATRERIGVNPLDRAKFILSVRNAL